MVSEEMFENVEGCQLAQWFQRRCLKMLKDGWMTDAGVIGIPILSHLLASLSGELIRYYIKCLKKENNVTTLYN